MEREITWTEVRTHFRKCTRQNLHQVIASVDDKGKPRLTPIGSLFLNYDQTGFYFEKYCASLPRFATGHPDICIMAVNTSKWYWFRSLYKGRFKGTPAVKLYGKLGHRRQATDQEMVRFENRFKLTKRLKGYNLLWKDLTFIREISFHEIRIVEFGNSVPVII